MNIADKRIVDADWAAITVVIFGVTAFSVSQGTNSSTALASQSQIDAMLRVR